MSLNVKLELSTIIGLDANLAEKLLDMDTTVIDATPLALSTGVLSQLASASETAVPFGDITTAALVILRSATEFTIKLNGGSEVFTVAVLGDFAVVILTAARTGVSVGVPGGASIDVVYAVAGS